MVDDGPAPHTASASRVSVRHELPMRRAATSLRVGFAKLPERAAPPYTA